jgi:rSAM/selenodomain-associated transferase 1
VDQLGVFARFWQPGTAKTRLAAAIGSVAASQFHRQCVLTVLARFRNIADRRVLAFTPRERRAEFASVAGKDWLIEAQRGGDLGRRMRHYFQSAFASGCRRVVLIGSDSPTMPPSRVHKAFRTLDQYDIVLVRSEDSGYYLVGARHEAPPIFAGVSWGTSEVWQQTLARLQKNNLTYDVLPTWYDVDEIEDLFRLNRELRSLVDRDPSDLSWRDLQRIVGRVSGRKPSVERN